MNVVDVINFLKDVLSGIGVLPYIYTAFVVGIGLTGISIVVKAVRG